MTPYFGSFSEFLQMGGHGFYVWLCYGLTFAAMLGLVIYAARERKRVLEQLHRHKPARLTNKQRQAQR